MFFGYALKTLTRGAFWDNTQVAFVKRYFSEYFFQFLFAEFHFLRES